MVETTEIQVPDIIAFSSEEFPIGFFNSEKKPIADTEFRYVADDDRPLTDKTDSSGLLKVRAKKFPPRVVSLSLPA